MRTKAAKIKKYSAQILGKKGLLLNCPRLKKDRLSSSKMTFNGTH